MTSSATASPPDHRRRFLESLATSDARLVGEGGRRRVADFGSVAAEHRALVETAGLLEAGARAFLRVEGPRATKMLDGLLTNDLEGAAAEGRAIYAFLLSAKGRPIADPRIVPLGEETYRLDLSFVALEGVEEHFTRYLPPRFASWEREPDADRISVVGPESDAALATAWEGPDPAAVAPLEAVRAEIAGARVLAVRRETSEGPGFDLYLPGESLQSAWESLAAEVRGRGGRPAGGDAWEILRVERGIPAYGVDITSDNLPQETGQTDRAISFDKGCYTGQEVVVRIQHRGHVNRHLRGLAPVDGEDARDTLAHGATLHRDGREVGHVSSAVRSPRLGPIALGYVRREVNPGEILVLVPSTEQEMDRETEEREGESDHRVRVVELPFVDR